MSLRKRDWGGPGNRVLSDAPATRRNVSAEIKGDKRAYYPLTQQEIVFDPSTMRMVVVREWTEWKFK